MNASGDAAEQIVRISLQGVELVGRMSKDMAEMLLKQIFAAAKDTKRTKGKTSLNSMLKSNKPVQIFELNDRELKKFCQAAKKYGVLYHVLKDRNKNDGKCDIMIRSEDSAKVNRIFSRFGIGISSKATVRPKIEKSVNEFKQAKEKEHPEKSAEDKFLDELFKKPANGEKAYNENPTLAKTGKSHPSEPTSSTPNRGNRTRDDSRPSVKALINEIEKSKKKSASTKSVPQKTKSKTKKKGAKTNGRTR